MWLSGNIVVVVVVVSCFSLFCAVFGPCGKLHWWRKISQTVTFTWWLAWCLAVA